MRPGIRAKTPAEIEYMRQGGHKLARILDYLKNQVKVGKSGKDISKIAAEKIKAAGLKPVLLGFQGYPDVMCVSVNDNIVHGLPNSKKFIDGDVVKLDITVSYKSMVIDTAATVVIGKPKPDIKRLVEGTERALYAAIDSIKGDGTRVGDIASATEAVLNKYKLGIVREMVGHGVGYEIHEDPNVPGYGVKGTGPVLMAGVTIAVEPMATLGDWKIKELDDGWTIASADGSNTAHFEHTVLITDDGAEILTAL